MIVKVTANEIEIKVESGNKSLCVDILNIEPISVEVQALIKGDIGNTGPQGIQGVQGIQGIQGVQGPSGGITGGGEIVIGTDDQLYYRKGLFGWFVVQGAPTSGTPPTGEDY
jgi:hypothetical protein